MIEPSLSIEPHLVFVPVHKTTDLAVGEEFLSVVFRGNAENLGFVRRVNAWPALRSMASKAGLLPARPLPLLRTKMLLPIPL